MPKIKEKRATVLYDLPRDKGVKIKAECRNEKNEVIGDMITFHHTDGMYSYCTVDGVEGNKAVIHLSVMTPLKWTGEYYEIADDNT